VKRNDREVGGSRVRVAALDRGSRILEASRCDLAGRLPVKFGKSIIRRRSAPSHAALLGDAGLGWIIQSIDLVHLEGAALDEKIQPGSVYSQKI
jgi:hypothetical protein